MASTKPGKSVANSVWLLIEPRKNEDVSVFYDYVRGVYASKIAATTAAVAIIEREFKEKGIDGKIHTWTWDQDWFGISDDDYWYLPLRDMWEHPNLRVSPDYRLVQYDVIGEGTVFKPTVWIQSYQAPRDPSSFSDCIEYNIEGVYESESLALAARSTGARQDHYRLKPHEIIE
jgi:hypothetical protein